MTNSGDWENDRELRDRILQGVEAAAGFQARFRKPLEGYLAAMCARDDGRSRERALHIVDQVLADCFIKSPSLLERWQGEDNLEAFLRTTAANRLKSWWSSAEKRRTEVDSESRKLSDAVAPDTTDQEFRDEIPVAGQALAAGVAEAAKHCPEGLVFLRLKGLHGVDQRAISHCWGHHESQTSRRIREAMALIRNTALEAAARHGHSLEMDALQRALQADPAILLGSEGAQVEPADDQLLRRLAAGGAQSADLRAGALRMCASAAALAFFARLLNRTDASEPVVVADPALSGLGPRLEECVRRTLDLLRPAEARGVITPLMAGVFGDALASIGADGGTLWLLDPGEAALEAVFNPFEAEIAGQRQALVSGIVSLVIATGEPCLVNGMASHDRHSPVIDIALGKTTHCMIAVPFSPAGSIRGVLTAVRLRSSTGFESRDLEIIGRQSDLLARLFVSGLVEKISGQSL